MDILAGGLFQQTISGNLRRNRDSIFGAGKKISTLFLLVQSCCETHVQYHILSGNQDDLLQTKEHYAAASDALVRNECRC